MEEGQWAGSVHRTPGLGSGGSSACCSSVFKELIEKTWDRQVKWQIPLKKVNPVEGRVKTIPA